MSAESATRDRAGDRTDGKRRRAINARSNGEPDGQTGASGENRATKRENGTGGRKRRADAARRNGKTARAGRKRRADGARGNGKTVRRRRERRAGSARRDGKPG